MDKLSECYRSLYACLLHKDQNWISKNHSYYNNDSCFLLLSCSGPHATNFINNTHKTHQDLAICLREFNISVDSCAFPFSRLVECSSFVASLNGYVRKRYFLVFVLKFCAALFYKTFCSEL